MKKMRILCFLLTVLLSVPSLTAQSDTTLVRKIKEYVHASSTIGNFNGTLLIAQKGTVIYKTAFGLADYEWNIPNVIDSKFRLASVSKQFTAMLILQLVQETKLKLDDKISTHLDYYRKDIGEKVSIRQLLTHCSGIPGYTELDSFFVRDAKLSHTTEQFVKKFCSRDLDFEPGTKLAYNNSAYFILGAIIEKITGMTYAEAVNSRIFSKLGMKNSGYDYNVPLLPKRTRGYAMGDTGQIVNSTYVDMSVPFSAGSLYSTVEDMHLWDRSFYSYTFLTPEWTDSMFSKKYAAFGYGWVNEKMYGKKVNMHSGGINGFSTVIYRFPEDEMVIVVLMNTEFGNASKVGMDLAAMFYNQAYTVPRIKKAIEVDEKIMKQYIGEYELAPEFIITVSVENKTLMIQATGQSKVGLKSETELDYFVDGHDISITFEKNKKNAVTGLILHQNGDHKAKKIK